MLNAKPQNIKGGRTGRQQQSVQCLDCRSTFQAGRVSRLSFPARLAPRERQAIPGKKNPPGTFAEMIFVVSLHSQRRKMILHVIQSYGVIGNTADFGSVVLGSSPSGSTKEKASAFAGAFCVVGPLGREVERSDIPLFSAVGLQGRHGA